MIEINSLEEMKEYYIKEVNTYVFDDDVKFNCDINIMANINACNINAHDINAYDISALNINALNISTLDINANNISVCNINAWDIKAWDINAKNINYYAVCVAYKNIRCNSIKSRCLKGKHFCLGGELIIENINENSNSNENKYNEKDFCSILQYQTKLLEEIKNSIKNKGD